MFLRPNTYRCRAGKRSWVMMIISYLKQSHQTLSNHTWTHLFFEGPVNKECQRSHDYSKVELPSLSLYSFDCPLSLSLSLSLSLFVYIYFPVWCSLNPSRFLCLPQASQKTPGCARVGPQNCWQEERAHAPYVLSSCVTPDTSSEIMYLHSHISTHQKLFWIVLGKILHNELCSSWVGLLTLPNKTVISYTNLIM